MIIGCAYDPVLKSGEENFITPMMVLAPTATRIASVEEVFKRMFRMLSELRDKGSMAMAT